MSRIVSLLFAFALLQAPVGAQDTTSRVTPAPQTKPAWFTRGDVGRIGLSTVGIGLITLVDQSAAKASQRRSLHNKPALQHSANFIQAAGDPGALITSASIYIIGSAVHRPGLADAGLHSTEAIAASGIITQVLKLSVGRARPNLTHDADAYSFRVGHGNTTDFNSFPSGHTTAAFAAATVFSAEINRLRPGTGSVTTPLLYGVATLVGASRMYNNRHWLSDVAAGALIGHFVGKRITAHAHGTH